MFNTSINFVRVIRDNFPAMLQQRIAMQWNRAFTKPVREMYQEFKALRQEYIFKVRFNGQACYLQEILNIRFDNALRRIHVVDTNERRNFLYENTAPTGENRIYTKWDNLTDFNPGQFAVEDRYLFEVVDTNIDVKPKESIEAGFTYWRRHTRRRLVLRSQKDGNARYMVFIPASLVYDEYEFISIMNTYRMAGLTYLIKKY